MQSIIFRNQIRQFSQRIDQSIIDYLSEAYIETFESYDAYSLIAFDWYDVMNLSKSPAQIIVYFDQDDLFFICENKTSYDVATSLYEEADSNERALYLFFRNLLKSQPSFLESMEDRISALDDSIMDGSSSWKREEIMKIKYETLRLKKFLEPLETAFELMCSNDNGCIRSEYMKYFVILRTRASDLTAEVQTLREYIAQVRDSYQAQISIEQNDVMKVFTMVTSIFLPLTLLVGWYGMNFSMPELGWKFGYPGVIIASVVTCVVWFILFKKKKWFK